MRAAKLFFFFFPSQITILSYSSSSLFFSGFQYPSFKYKPQGFDQWPDPSLSDVVHGVVPIGCLPMSMPNYGAGLISCKCLSLMSP